MKMYFVGKREEVTQQTPQSGWLQAGRPGFDSRQGKDLSFFHHIW
jgi:hypothetical protein